MSARQSAHHYIRVCLTLSCVTPFLFSRVHATLYVTMSVGPSFGPSVRRSVRPSVGPSVGNHFVQNHFFVRLELIGDQI